MIQKLGTRDVYGDLLVRLGHENQDIVVLDADLSCSTRTQKFAMEFPSRFFNMGISEQDMMATAAGLAASGKIPFVSTFAVFAAGRAWDQVRQSLCYSVQNVKIAATHAGITVGEDSATHQANEDIALMRSLPNMSIIVPADGVETEKVMEYLVRHKGPVYLRLSRCKFPVIFDSGYVFEKGKAVLLEEGTEATVIAIGCMVSRGQKACEMLKKEGISIRLLNMSTVKPIDNAAILAAAQETGAIVTVEEHSIIGGLGSAVAESVSEQCPVPLKRIGVRDCFGMSGTPDELLQHYGLTPEAIVEAVKEVIARKGKA